MNPVEGISVINNTNKRSSKRIKHTATNLNYYKLGGSPIVEPYDIMTKCKVCKAEVKYREDGSPYCQCTYRQQIKSLNIDKNTLLIRTQSIKTPNMRYRSLFHTPP